MKNFPPFFSEMSFKKNSLNFEWFLCETVRFWKQSFLLFFNRFNHSASAFTVPLKKIFNKNKNFMPRKLQKHIFPSAIIFSWLCASVWNCTDRKIIPFNFFLKHNANIFGIPNSSTFHQIPKKKIIKKQLLMFVCKYSNHGSAWRFSVQLQTS